MTAIVSTLPAVLNEAAGTYNPLQSLLTKNPTPQHLQQHGNSDTIQLTIRFTSRRNHIRHERTGIMAQCLSSLQSYIPADSGKIQQHSHTAPWPGS